MTEILYVKQYCGLVMTNASYFNMCCQDVDTWYEYMNLYMKKESNIQFKYTFCHIVIRIIAFHEIWMWKHYTQIKLHLRSSRRALQEHLPMISAPFP